MFCSIREPIPEFLNLVSTAKCSMNNGLLYIEMNYKKEEVKKKENILKIQ
jgi:HSP20 family molecular chaperone IbpA